MIHIPLLFTFILIAGISTWWLIKQGDGIATPPELLLRSSSKKADEYRRLVRNRYIVGYGLMACADWLQGPYLYAMYRGFGLGDGDIGRLYVVDLAVAAAVSSYLGGRVDSAGRRFCCVLYCIVYAASNLLNNLFPVLGISVLFLGCALDGACNSLLKSAPETWLAAESEKRGAQAHWIGHTLAMASLASTLGSVLAGWACSAVVYVSGGSYVATMNVAAAILLGAAVYVQSAWSENHGCAAEKASAQDDSDTVRRADTFSKKRDLLFLVSLTECCFEGAVMLFIYLWAPTLNAVSTSSSSSSSDDDMPFGPTFSILMSFMMAGNVFSSWRAKNATTTEIVLDRFVLDLVGCCSVAAVSFIFLALNYNNNTYFVVIVCLCAVEFSCGVFFPTIGAVHSQLINSDVMGSTIGRTRTLINVVAVGVLLLGDVLELRALWLCGGGLLASGVVFSVVALHRVRHLVAHGKRE
eukprot:PhM_4_TR1700/c0_g1_i1/m.5973